MTRVLVAEDIGASGVDLLRDGALVVPTSPGLGV